jgi:NADPH-dependent glutamate synthase beta subunit-like oxidoreductase
VRGASLVVWAIADGRKVAAHILDYLALKQAARVA